MRRKRVVDPNLIMPLGGGKRAKLAAQREIERAADRGEILLPESYERKFPSADVPLIERFKAWLFPRDQ